MSIQGKCNEGLVSAAKIAVVADAVYNNPTRDPSMVVYVVHGEKQGGHPCCTFHPK